MKIDFDTAVNVSRFVTRTVVSSGAAAIVTNAVKATTPEDISKLKKLTVVVGTMAIGGVVAEAANSHVMKGFDDIVSSIKKTFNDVEEDSETVEGTVVDD